MNSQNIREEIMFMEKRKDNFCKKILELQEKLTNSEKEHDNLRIQIESKYRELANVILSETNRSWCTKCDTVAPANTFSLLFIKGNRKESCGHEGDCYTFREFSVLHRVCSFCLQSAQNSHGWVGDWDSSLKSQESYFAFKVTEANDGVRFADIHGKRVAIDAKYELKAMSKKVLDNIISE